MDTLLFANLDRGTIGTDETGTAFSWPELIQGDDVRLQLRFARGGVETRPEVTAVRMSLGRVDARPTDGSFRLDVDGFESGVISWNASAAQVANALVGCPSGAPSVREVFGGWVVTFAGVDAGEEPVEIALAESSLSPVCFLVVRTYDEGARKAHELRLVQSPVAFTSAFARIVAPAPVISEVQAGGSFEGLTWNEVQKLHVDPRFTGTYQLRWDYRRTIPLTTADGAAEIQAALNAIAQEGEAWTVGNPDTNTAFIEFTGEEFVGQDLANLEVFVVDAPPGDVTLVLPLNTREVADVLRGGDVTDLILEIEVTLEENEVPVRYTVCRQVVTLRREVIRDGMEELQAIDWVNPPGPVSHEAYDPDSVITGDQHFVNTIGNGTATVFNVTHELGSRNLHVSLCRAAGNEALLVHGVDYSVRIEDPNQIVITMLTGGAPALNALILTVTAAGPRSAFQGHGHQMSQITGLNPALEAIVGRITALEDLAPTGDLAARATDEAPVLSVELPVVSSVYPTRMAVPVTGSLLGLDVAKIKAGGLLPAVHTSTAAIALTSPLPVAEASHAGRIYRNDGSAPVRLPGGGGRVGYDLPVSGLATVVWDAVRSVGAWYPVERFGTENTYYPAQFEVPLFEFVVLAEQFRAKRRFTIDLGFEVGILRATSRAQWVLAIEYGTLGAVSSPATQGPNFSGITWLTAAPALDQRIFLSPTPTVHRLGLTIDRAANGTLSAVKRLYGDSVNTVAPASAQFAIRGRLTRFDPGNEAHPLGLVAVRGVNLGVDGEVDAGLGRAKIV